MDFIGNKCPVCDRYFHGDDDVVVCPECGTPHHRDCYESIGHCANEERHAEGYDFTQDETNNDNADVVICKNCGKENDKYQFFCKYCSAPLQSEERNQAPNNAQQQQQQQQQTPFGNIGGMPGAMPGGIPFTDPLGGVPADTDFGEGITAGEMSKYVKQNTPYFTRVFNNIKQFNRSKFNFAAALFSGGYMLYRKMYKLGAILFAIEVALYAGMMYAVVANYELYQNFLNTYSQGVSNSADYLAGLNTTQALMIYLPAIVWVLLLGMMILIGARFNRWYMKHCQQQIKKIKQEAKEDENPETLLQTKGGVNTPLAISLLITAIIIRYIPSILMGII